MSFRAPSKSLSLRDYLFIALTAILFLIVSAALISWNLTLDGGGDFYVHWVASRAFVFEKIDPYSVEIPARVQELVYQRPARLHEEPYILDTPFHILLLYFPFSLFSSPQFARAFFTLIVEFSLLTLSLLSLRLTDWETPTLFTAMFAAFSLFNFYSWQAVYEASPVALLGFIYAGILLALRFELDELAGGLIAVSLYYWEVGAPFLFLVLWRVYVEKRSRVFAGLFMLGFIMLTVSFLLYANWVIPFLRATLGSLRADFGFNAHSALVHIFPAQGRILAWVLILALVVALGYEWSIARNADFRRFYWASCLSIAAAPLLGFRVEMEYLSILILPLALIFSIIYDRWHKIAHFLVVLFALFLFLIPWALSQTSLPAAQEIIFLFLPIFTVIGLYWIRWWALRPPRIWTDLAPRS